MIVKINETKDLIELNGLCFFAMSHRSRIVFRCLFSSFLSVPTLLNFF